MSPPTDLRLLEHYVSIQGEGPRVGELTQFVRFAGCNLRCPGWPCDTPYAIEPRQWRKEFKSKTARILAQEIKDIARDTGAYNVCLTGGEPLIQSTSSLEELTTSIFEGGKFSIEMFTNGSIRIPTELLKMCTFIMDWKLPGSGETVDNNIRIQNVKRLGEWQSNSIKFVVKDRDDFVNALGNWRHYIKAYDINIFVGPVWDVVSSEEIVKMMIEFCVPWRLNTQIQNYIFGPHKRGT